MFTKNLILTFFVTTATLTIHNIVGETALIFGNSCNDMSECSPNEDCFQNQCVNACHEISCPVGAKCITSDDKPTCICDDEAGYVWSQTDSCIKQCLTNSDCGKYTVCENNRCIHACSNLNCNIDAFEDCHLDGNHNARCECIEGYSRNDAESPCEPNLAACTNNNDCNDIMVCEQNKCINVCSSMKCGDHEECLPQNHHTAICICRNGYSRHPHTDKCEFECTSDGDCGKHQTCQIDQYDFRTCQCISGFIQLPSDSECRQECRFHVDCSGRDMCHRKRCITAAMYADVTLDQ